MFRLSCKRNGQNRCWWRELFIHEAFKRGCWDWYWPRSSKVLRSPRRRMVSGDSKPHRASWFHPCKRCLGWTCKTHWCHLCRIQRCPVVWPSCVQFETMDWRTNLRGFDLLAPSSFCWLTRTNHRGLWVQDHDDSRSLWSRRDVQMSRCKEHRLWKSNNLLIFTKEMINT